MTMLAGVNSSVDVSRVTLGVDTHADSHVAAVIDFLGRHLGAPVTSSRSGCSAWREPVLSGPEPRR